MKQRVCLFLAAVISISSLWATKTCSYHGKRMGAHIPFDLVFIETETDVLRIFFTLPVDPRTVSVQSIIINGEPLPEGSSIRFSRSGKLVECTLTAALAEESAISLADIRSFDGRSLRNAEIDGIRQNMRWHHRLPHKMKQEHRQ